MEKINIYGSVKSMRKDKTAVQLIVSDEEGDVEEWFQLAPAVKPEYIYIGSKIEECSVSAEKDEESGNRMVFFIRCEKPIKKNFQAFKSSVMPRSNLTPKGEKAVAESDDNRFQSLIVAEAVFHGTGKTEEFKKFQEEVHEYLNKGMWITTQKIKKSVEPEPEEIEEAQY